VSEGPQHDWCHSSVEPICHQLSSTAISGFPLHGRPPCWPQRRTRNTRMSILCDTPRNEEGRRSWRWPTVRREGRQASDSPIAVEFHHPRLGRAVVAVDPWRVCVLGISVGARDVRRLTVATAPPIANPSPTAAATSVGKCRPVDSLDQATAQARVPTGTAVAGAAAPVATA
jgi:hypothetical protein